MSSDSRVPAAPAPEAPFLKDLFGALKSSGIPYCVLRNYEGLPESLRGSDLDLLVGEGAALAAIRRVIVETVDKHRGRMLWRAKNESLSSALCVAGAGTGAVWGVAIDVFTGLRWRGIDYYDARWLLSRARERDGVRVAGFCDASVVGMLKDLLEGGRLRPGSATPGTRRRPSVRSRRWSAASSPASSPAPRISSPGRSATVSPEIRGSSCARCGEPCSAASSLRR
jgi:hypothetical protein